MTQTFSSACDALELLPWMLRFAFMFCLMFLRNGDWKFLGLITRTWMLNV